VDDDRFQGQMLAHVVRIEGRTETLEAKLQAHERSNTERFLDVNDRIESRAGRLDTKLDGALARIKDLEAANSSARVDALQELQGIIIDQKQKLDTHATRKWEWAKGIGLLVIASLLTFIAAILVRILMGV
jgi:hypothetical protein